MSQSALRFETDDASTDEAEARERFARSVALACHRVIAVVHLGHLLTIVARKEDMGHCGFNPHLLARMNLSTYGEYRTRLDAFIRQREEPLLVFCSSEYHPYAPEWVRAVRPAGVCAFVETPPGDPQPLLDRIVGTEERWQWLADRLKAVDVRRITLIGEAAFTHDGGQDRQGCVWAATKRLDAHFETEIIHHLTYPDVDVPRVDC